MLVSNIRTAIMSTLTFALTIHAAAIPEAVEKRQCLGGSHAECVPLATTECQLRCSNRKPVGQAVCNEQCIVKAGEQCINDC